MTKLYMVLAFLTGAVALVLGSQILAFDASAQGGKKPPEIITLGTEAKLGSIKFSHVDHITKNRSIESSQVTCVECHHTAQPAAEAAKHPPLKTVWPADRATTLTMELAEKDANAVGAVCRDCHARADTKPKLLPELPTIKLEVGTELVTLNNQQAFHRNCAGCHDEIAKTRTDVTPPTSKKCTACHKRAAA
jgi:cytochrome c553